MSNITIVIDAKDSASRVLLNLSKSINSLSTGNATSNMNQLSASISGLAGSGNIFVAIAESVITVASSLNDLAYSGAQLDRLERGANSLGKEYGMTSNEIINAVDKITQGTLSQTSILQQANQAMLLGVAHSEEELTTLAAIAADRGRKMGISMEKAFSSIVLGVGRLSPLILDNLGIILDADVTYAKYAKTIGKTADSLTDMEKRQALLSRLQEEMESMTSVPEDDKTAWEKLGASISDVTGALGNFINEYLRFNEIVAFVSDQINLATGAINDTMLTGIEKQKKELKDLTSYYDDLQRGLQRVKDSANQPMSDQSLDTGLGGIGGGGRAYEVAVIEEQRVKLLQESARALEKIELLERNYMRSLQVANQQENARLEIKKQAEIVAAEEERLNQENILIQEKWNNLVSDYANLKNVSKHEAELLAQALYKGEVITQSLVNRFSSFIAKLQHAEDAANRIRSAIEGIYSGVRSSAIEAYISTGFNREIFDLYKEQKKEINETVLEMRKRNISEDELAFKVAEVESKHSEVFDSISESVKETEKLKSATSKVTEEFSSLKGIVEGIVGGLYEDIGGVKVEDFLPYEDAPNEAAKRIADVMVKGFDSPWASYFKDTFPDLFTKYSDLAGGDVKKAAGLLLKDFQAGLAPELIDKGKVKELAKRMFMADQASKAMIDEIAKDLASELGISIEEATGAVTSATGMKKPLSGDEIKKIISETKLTPTFDLSSSKKDFEQAAKDSGFADQNGKVFVNVTALINEVKKSDQLPPDALTITTGLKFPTQEIVQLAISGHFPSLYLNTNLKITKENLDGFTTILNSMMETNPALIYADLYVSSVEDFVYQTQTLLNLHSLTLPVDFLSSTAEQFSTMLVPFTEQLKASFEGEGGIAASVAKSLEDSMMNNQDILEFQGIMFAAHFFNGFSNSGVGRSLAFELNRQLSESESLIEASGKTAGGKWGQSFLEVVGRDVPFELLTILVNLITPEVKKRVAEERTRQ
jgi:hypothetical protein